MAPPSTSGAAKHLDPLATAGLVADVRDGRQRLWRVTPRPMVEAAEWLAAAGSARDERLARLAAATTPSEARRVTARTRDDRPDGGGAPPIP
ncbi:hypothetical protein [Iamia sp.]|uniref:hypothetical protein n=1 Tax=Iamia sp. TaxID=2722710 RepID=UPI002BB8B552|nr:hypothetical protein [Iamia sp.]HXH55668.1 hypothetical protein [Iamia sp.]